MIPANSNGGLNVPKSIKTFVFCFSLIFVATIAAAQNLVINGTFDTTTSSWNFTTPGTFTHSSSLDADGNAPLSGSGQLANSSTAASGTSFAAQCITAGIIGSTNYDFGAQIRFDTNNTQTGSGRANVVVSFFDGPNCSGNNVGGSTTPNFLSSNTNIWTQNEVLAFTSPPGSLTAQLSLWTVKTEATGTMTVNFDNVVFGPAGILPVELTSFDVE